MRAFLIKIALSCILSCIAMNFEYAYANNDAEVFKTTIFASEKLSGTKFFSKIVESREARSSGSLKITVTSKFLNESSVLRQQLMEDVYKAWTQVYKGQDEPVITFIDSKNKNVGVASKEGCIASPIVTVTKEPKPAKQKEKNCYKLGYRYGRCRGMSIAGLHCYRGDKISIPRECRYHKDKDRGVNAGIREGQRIAGKSSF